MPNIEISDTEYLYRGIVDANWDYERNRPSSATFKDSFGVSVNRDDHRDENLCVQELLEIRNFKGICKILTSAVREIGAVAFYKPIPLNIYHSEIHSSVDIIQIKGKKAKDLRTESELVYQN